MSLIKRAFQYKQSFFNPLATQMGQRALMGGAIGAGVGAIGGHAVGDPGHWFRGGNQGQTTMMGALGGGALGAGLGALGMRPGATSRLTDKARLLRTARGGPAAAATVASKPRVVMPQGYSPTVNFMDQAVAKMNPEQLKAYRSVDPAFANAARMDNALHPASSTYLPLNKVEQYRNILNKPVGSAPMQLNDKNLPQYMDFLRGYQG